MGLTISRQSKTPSFFSPISHDLLLEIVSRLSVEDLARCRCVSKQWASVLRRRLTNSSTSPRLLFTFHLNDKWVFFSAPQPQNPDQNSSLLTAEYHMCFPTKDCSFGICPPVCGLICNRDRGFMVCNPSTGEYKSLPNPTWMKAELRTFFGFDPVAKQYKVLCVHFCRNPKPSIQKAKVLTLGIGTLSWRKILCSRPYDSIGRFGICISGVLYYGALRSRFQNFMIVCFVLSSEKFEFISPPPMKELLWHTHLINYKGKLGVLDPMLVFGTTESIELWVLDDAEEGRWSRHIYIFPPIWKDLVATEDIFRVDGMNCNGDIVLSSYSPSDRFYVLIYNVERNTVTKFTIQGFGSRKGSGISTFIDHIENLNPIPM